jgi:hypothetical protein
MTESQARTRIAEIDAVFETAANWGSWMIGLANEREELALKFGFAHKNQARCGGRRTD